MSRSLIQKQLKSIPFINNNKEDKSSFYENKLYDICERFCEDEDKETFYIDFCYNFIYEIKNMKSLNDLDQYLTTFDDQTEIDRFHLPSFDPIKQKFKKNYENIVKPIEITEGIYKCFKCGSKKTKFTQGGTRSADEPLTVFIECTNCKKKWREN